MVDAMLLEKYAAQRRAAHELTETIGKLKSVLEYMTLEIVQTEATFSDYVEQSDL